MKKKPIVELLDTFPDGEKNKKGMVCGTPPKKVAEVIGRLTPSPLLLIDGDNQLNRGGTASRISKRDLKILNDYAAKLAGVDDCKIRAIYGCGSCPLGCRRIGGLQGELEYQILGNRVVTDCGEQCWRCGRAWGC